MSAGSVSSNGSSPDRAGISAGKTPRSAKNSRTPIGTSDRARNVVSDSTGIRSSVAWAVAANLAIRIIQEENQNRQLLVSARRDRAGGREQSDLSRHFASFEKIQKRRGRAHGFVTKVL